MGHCRWPGGCDQPASACEVHHVKHKADGGPTSVRGCVLLCSFHYQVAIHRWGWTRTGRPRRGTRTRPPCCTATDRPPVPGRDPGGSPVSERNVGGRRYRERVLESFHPAVRAWFEGRFPAGPTEPQADGWQEIAAGHHTLIAAPTGSGKTLAAFLVCIDQFYRARDLCCAHDLYCGHELLAEGAPGGLEGATPAGSGPQVVYVSPLKALATDIQQNLEAPLREIAAVAGRLGLTAPAINVAVRTGDTAA